jgi:hypothetical protein
MARVVCVDKHTTELTVLARPSDRTGLRGLDRARVLRAFALVVGYGRLEDFLRGTKLQELT